MPVIGAYGCCLLIGLAGISTERMFGRNYNSLRTAQKYPVRFAKSTSFKNSFYPLCLGKLSVTQSI